MKLNKKFDKPMLFAGMFLVLLGVIYQNLEYLPVELSDLFFWLPKEEYGYFKLVESEPEFDFGLIFFILGILLLVIRSKFIKIDK